VPPSHAVASRSRRFRLVENNPALLSRRSVQGLLMLLRLLQYSLQRIELLLHC
jgi:hypothetical protein